MRSYFRVLVEQSNPHLTALRKNIGRQCCPESRAEQITRVLRRTGLTITQISAATGTKYGTQTSFFVPPTFLYKQKQGVTPHICQIVALSEVTGFRFTDWMRICGFDLRLIFALQLHLHVERTVVVTPDPAAVTLPRPAQPIGEWKEPDPRYLYAKIGASDVVCYPTLLPGSIVRADRSYSPKLISEASSANALWLVEYPGGLTCCRIALVDQTHIALLPSQSPLPKWPLRLTTEARVLGLVDQQFRPRVIPPRAPYRSLRFEHDLSAIHKNSTMHVSRLVRVSRSRAGLTLRAAHGMTMAIARMLETPEYGIALGQLSDYEATDKLPRHVAKVVSLCVVYGIQVWDLMAAAGVRVDDSRKISIGPEEAGPGLPMNSNGSGRHLEEYGCGAGEVAISGSRARAERGVA